MGLASVVSRLNKNKFFRFVSSVRLAVPTMLILCIFVGWGTILESLYNAEYAALIVYKSWWFSIFMMILWLNIFCAPLARYPFKKHQIGFVVTHIGLLILLAGGLVTNRFGTDGQLQVMEGGSNSSVMLSRLMVGYQTEGSPSVQKMVFDRSLYPKDSSDLDFINKELGAWFKVNQYLPFAKVEKNYESSPGNSEDTSVSFIMKSQFFNVTEWLSTQDEPEKQMGPATLRIVKGTYVAKADKKAPPKRSSPKKRSTSAAAEMEVVRILDAKTEKEIQTVALTKLLSKPVTVNGVTIVLNKKFNNAIVAANKLAEGDPSGSNPALEFELKKGSETKREVSYAKHATFSLHPEGAFGLRLQYSGGISGATAAPDISEEEAPPVHMSQRPGGNVIEFHIPDGAPNKAEEKVQVVLFKNGEFVQEALVGPGEKMQTPWMGMQLFIGSILRNSQAAIVARPAPLEKKSNLPPSAIELNVDAASPSLWLSEGDEKEIMVGNKRIHVFYGRESLTLPFEVALKKFSKIDYPGTETPMSYESLVQINGRGPVTKISMNEPMKIEGYTVYQASYSMTPNGPPISVFSVNKDPGRFWKYLGSLILAIGVIIYTLMKSRLYRKERKGSL
ncbi:MAG: cytochrome c biogenesis protein ResB [Pseudobdellovibrionaceae bacterium]